MRVKVYFFPTKSNEQFKFYDLNIGATVADLVQSIKNDSNAPGSYRDANAIEIAQDGPQPNGALSDTQALEDGGMYLAKFGVGRTD